MSALYPLRHRIAYKIPYCIRELWWAIRDWFSPKQKWLTKQIPNHWIDKDTLWEICVLEGIKHYVEGEKALEYFDEGQNDPQYPDHQKKFDREVQWAYDEITIRLPHLERLMDEELLKIRKNRELDSHCPHKLSDYEKVYGEHDRLEKEIEDCKTEVMVWAVKNRGSIWT